MREIKFRAWDKRNKIMYMVDDMSFRANHDVFRVWGKHNREEFHIINPDDTFLMQYTGLKDKNGKEIYEDDIVKMLSRSFTQVYFADGGFCVDVGGELVGLHPDFLGRYRTVEVVGNIYENPELLEKNKCKSTN